MAEQPDGTGTAASATKIPSPTAATEPAPASEPETLQRSADLPQPGQKLAMIRQMEKQRRSRRRARSTNSGKSQYPESELLCYPMP